MMSSSSVPGSKEETTKQDLTLLAKDDVDQNCGDESATIPSLPGLKKGIYSLSSCSYQKFDFSQEEPFRPTTSENRAVSLQELDHMNKRQAQTGQPVSLAESVNLSTFSNESASVSFKQTFKKPNSAALWRARIFRRKGRKKATSNEAHKGETRPSLQSA